MKKKRMIRSCLAIVIMLSLLLANQTGVYNILDVHAEIAEQHAGNTMTMAANAAHTHNDVTFQEWSGTNSLPSAAGNYYLTNDVTLNSYYEIPGNINLCLCGHKIEGSVSGGMIRVNGYALNIYDCQGGGWVYCPGINNPIQVSQNGALSLYGGTVQSETRTAIPIGTGSSDSTGGTVNIYSGASVIGGTNGIYVNPNLQSSYVNIYGGTIEGTTSISMKNESGSIAIHGDANINSAISTVTPVKAVDTGQSGLSKTYTINYTNVQNGTIVVQGSTDNTHYQLDHTTYTLWPQDGNLTARVVYTVTLNGNGGSGTQLESYGSGIETSLPTDWTKAGYTFGGWYENANFTGSRVTSIPTNATGNKTYYAKWTANTYTVTYNKNSGTIASESSYTSYTYGTGLTLPTPTRTGYTFGGWYTSSSFSGSAVTAITTTDTGDKTYYAKWTVNTYTVTYNKNSGTIASESSYTSYTYGTGLTLPTPTRTGYTFGGWYTSSSFSGSAVTAITATDTGNKTYYAKWTVNTYTVTYNKNSGTIASESNYTSYTYGTGLTLPTPTRTGYTFGGWYTSSSFSGSAVTAITATDTGDKTYYAKWTVNTYTVTYNKNSGTIASESSYTSYTYGTGLTLPTPTRTGYTFGGWYTSASFSGSAVTAITTTDTGNKTYYAKWTDDIAPVIGTLRYSYSPTSLWQLLIGKKDLVITVPVTEEGSGATEITYTETPEGGQASQKRSAITNGEARITFDADFRGTIVITCTDQANNTSKSVTVGTGLNATGLIIEDHAPEIVCEVNKQEVSAEKYYDAPDITVTVTDDRNSVISGGIASVSWQIGDHTEILKRDFTASMITSAVFTIPAADIPAGETEITITATDNAGNRTVLVQKISVMTDAEKVAMAKQAVEKALAGITAANDTTKDDIQKIMDTALTNAGISSNDVTVTVGELSKTKAAADAAGSISGSISIVSKADADVSDSVPVDKTIDRLPVTDEEKVEAAKKVVQEALAGITVTNDTTKDDIQNVIDNALSKAELTDVTVTVEKLFKTEATAEEEGSISGSISIVSKGDADVSDSVPVEKAIDPLPETDEEKVAAAKKVVQEALAGITAANDTTKEDIQNVIDNALSKAGLTDVTVTVGELDKTEATTEETGSISGSITIVSKEDADVSDYVPVGKTIARLPETDEEKVAAAKKIVQEVLAGITAANDTTGDDIQNAIDYALGKVGLVDVTVIVGELDKTEATTEEAGSISGSITIVSKEDADVSDSVPVGKTIARLPETDEEKVAAAKKVVQEALAGITATNDISKDEIQNVMDNALDKAGLADVAVTVGELDKTEATTKKAGSISGSIDISCGTASGSVPVGKTIAQLPATDAGKVEAAKKVVQEVLAGITATNEITRDEIQSVIDHALEKAGLAEDVTVILDDLARTEATTSEPGSISGNIAIVCGTADDSVPVNKTIAQLPKTPEEKAAEAKAAVEEALAGITVTNDTTKEDIQKVIDEALSDAGITDVTVTVEDFVRTEATTSAPGSITGSISIACEDVSDSVPVTGTIEQLPKTEEEKVAEAQKVVDGVLAGITVTNDTTKDDLQRVIDAALSNAGITDVTVTVGDLVKTEATTEEAGSISGSIVIGSREDESVSVHVPITVIIDRLPQDKPDVSDKQEKPDVSDKPDTPAVSGNQPGQTEQPSGSGSVSNAARPGNSRNDGNGSNGRQPQTVEQTVPEADPSGETDTGKPAPGGEMGQTIPVSLDQDKAVIKGEPAAAGTVQGMAGTSLGLKLGDGMVIVTVVCEEQEYTAGVADTVAVANAVLTPDQIQSVNDGETIEIRVDVKDISQNMPASDKEVIESGVEEYRKDMPELTLGMYVDISVFIRVGTGGWDAVTSTREPVEVVIGIPEELREDGREFYIIRSHEGEYAFLEDIDGDPDTITISTDMFSAYAIAYRQTDETKGDRCGLCHICPTFLGICCFIWLAIVLAAVLAVVWISLSRMRKESRKRP